MINIGASKSYLQKYYKTFGFVITKDLQALILTL